MEKEIDVSFKVLKTAFGVVPIVAGADKFLNLLADWPAYISPFARGLLPISPEIFMMVVGIIEIAVGIAVLSSLTRYASVVAAAWLSLIGVNLLIAGYFDVAVRDFVMAASALVLHNLTVVKERESAGYTNKVYSAQKA